MCLSAILGVGSAIVGASSASKAAKAQTQAADKASNVQKQMFDQTSQYFEPYRDAGENALRAYQYELGLGPMPGSVGGTPMTIEEIPGTPASGGTGSIFSGRPSGASDMWLFEQLAKQQQGQAAATPATYRVNGQDFGTRDEAQAYVDSQPGSTPYQGFTATPGYDFRLKEGLNAVEGSAAARGGLMSGATLQGLQQYGQDYATNAYDNWLNRVGGVMSTGQASAGQQAALGQNFANNQSNILQSAGNARSAGAIGVGNAINDGIGNFAGMYQYNKLLDKY